VKDDRGDWGRCDRSGPEICRIESAVEICLVVVHKEVTLPVGVADAKPDAAEKLNVTG